ncbi:uncharacterized protein EV420DRAFT_1648407 [Desarmillaria tabescens]|uniref:Uncharacterized protein n=1 Tax=Armillaria tabescens TaxID=1929756 RepID=A0AA39JPT7_ARMTA|nr:uncharacterized protein EV420DRAFT_1648407 [Desarmillaria tabescens]KAK0445269.1 hypothetical protein EV420DRAFT_1648407 [Desarmillaria tabescens]
MISWTMQSGDPSVFSIELVLINQSFHSQYAITRSLSLTLPQISAQHLVHLDLFVGWFLMLMDCLFCRDGYTTELMNISNINDIYAQTSTFSISEPVSSSASTLSTGSASESSSASASVSASVSASGLASVSSSASGSVSPTASGFISHASSASASASGSSTYAFSTSPSTSSATATASTSAFNAALHVQIGGAGVFTAVLAWVIAL